MPCVPYTVAAQASVNVDAELVRQGGGLVQQEEKMIELSNGCICCTLREDLLTSLASLASERRFDHVLVESSGISECVRRTRACEIRPHARASSHWREKEGCTHRPEEEGRCTLLTAACSTPADLAGRCQSRRPSPSRRRRAA